MAFSNINVIIQKNTYFLFGGKKFPRNLANFRWRYFWPSKLSILYWYFLLYDIRSLCKGESGFWLTRSITSLEPINPWLSQIKTQPETRHQNIIMPMCCIRRLFHIITSYFITILIKFVIWPKMAKFQKSLEILWKNDRKMVKSGASSSLTTRKCLKYIYLLLSTQI